MFGLSQSKPKMPWEMGPAQGFPGMPTFAIQADIPVTGVVGYAKILQDSRAAIDNVEVNQSNVDGTHTVEI